MSCIFCNGGGDGDPPSWEEIEATIDEYPIVAWLWAKKKFVREEKKKLDNGKQLSPECKKVMLRLKKLTSPLEGEQQP